MILRYKNRACLMLATLINSAYCYSDLQPLDKQQMRAISGQSGISISADIITNAFNLSYLNAGRVGEDKYLIADGMQLNLSIENMTLDVTGNFNGTSALVLGLPTRVVFNNTTLGNLTTSWTEDGSTPVDNATASTSYLLQVGTTNVPFDTFGSDTLNYRLTHNNTTTSRIENISTGTYNSGQWSMQDLVFSAGQAQTATFTVDTSGVYNLSFSGDVNDECGFACNDPEVFIRLIDTQNLSEQYRDTGDKTLNWNSIALGAPSALKANRVLGNLTINGGFSISGQTYIFVK